MAIYSKDQGKKSPFTFGVSNNGKFVGPLKNPPFIPGNGNPKNKFVGPINRKFAYSSRDKDNKTAGSRGGGGLFNDNVILDTSQVVRGRNIQQDAIDRRLASIRANNKGYN